MNQIDKSDLIAGMLFQSRQPSWNSDDTLALSAAIKNITPDEAKIALMKFTMGMLAAAKNITELQRDAAIAADLLDQQNGSPLH